MNAGMGGKLTLWIVVLITRVVLLKLPSFRI